MTKLKITQIRSTIDRKKEHKRTITALGLGKIRRTVVHNDPPQIRGLVRAVRHLVKFEEIEE
jgi:large subunit ribosomal protein L30